MADFRWAWFDDEGNEVKPETVTTSYIAPLDLSPQKGEGEVKIVTLKKVKLDAKV